MGVGGVTNIAGDIVRVVTTAGSSKDVIDLNENRATFPEEQVTLFEHEYMTLLRENRNLAFENQKLKRQLQNTPSKTELSEQTAAILKYFLAKAGNGVSDREIACHFQVPMSNVTPHTYLLWKKKFIAGNGLVAIRSGRSSGDEATCAITMAGRTYCKENGLAS